MKIIASAIVSLMCAMRLFGQTILAPQPPIELTGTHGKFDFIKVDAARHRLLACHTGNGSLDVIDLNSQKLIASVPTGAAQGVAMDEAGRRYFVSVSRPPQMVVVDATKLVITGTVPLPEPADLVAYSSALHRAFVDDDVKPKMWVIDPQVKLIESTILFPGTGMEDFCLDPGEMLLAQNLKDTSQLAWINPDGKIIHLASTLPAEKPHGLARIGNGETILVAGGTGTLVLMDVSGKILSSCPIAARVDEITYDGALHRAYCASGLGQISVIDVTAIALRPLGTIASAVGAHSIAVDPKTHQVWIAFAKSEKAYVQAFAPAQP